MHVSSRNFVAPMTIFTRQRMKLELTDGAHPGTIFRRNMSAWMMLDAFIFYWC